MKNKIIALCLSTFAVAAGLACTQQGYSKCGKCNGCTYVIVCGASTEVGQDGGSVGINVQLCTGHSLGTLDRDCSSGHAFGSYYCLSTLSICGASVQLTGTCCNGSRTTTTDMTPIMDTTPQWSGCNNRS